MYHYICNTIRFTRLILVWKQAIAYINSFFVFSAALFDIHAQLLGNSENDLKYHPCSISNLEGRWTKLFEISHYMARAYLYSIYILYIYIYITFQPLPKYNKMVYKINTGPTYTGLSIGKIWNDVESTS